ncbi:ParB/RepB/Spo0J family partition protein [Streptomyces sp. E1N211]|uniref:ParB/RepB/Spo0J family partition protein n=1 Tax=Streptomyces sp. E1N211 TaxID=1851876 RepID=UPI0018C2D2BF|nr:ParB/RepB/Spo0J family partition protein [Streptomyces sp. E1N211]
MAGQLKRAKRKPGAPASPAPQQPDAGPKFFELGSEADGDALKLKTSDISANPFNDRDLGDVSDLASSIEMDGLLQDIVVMHTSVFAEHYPDAASGITTKYVIAFGERRWRAHQHIGKEEISAVLRNDVAPKIRRVLFVENFHRKQLSPIEEARRFQALHEDGMSYRQIAEELSLGGPNHVSRRLELLRLPTALQNIVGTEDGPGVTLARSILAQLAEPDEQIRAWELIRDENLTLGQAVDRIRNADAVPPGNTPAEETGPAPVPQGNTSGDSEDTAPVPQGNTDVPAPRTTGDAPKPAAAKPKTPAGAQTLAADRDTAERNNASADRDQACRQLITNGSKLTPDQHAALMGRTLLAPMQQGPARTRAHRWLRDAGVAVFNISDTDSYFEAVLSSGQTELVNRVAVATAVAAGEVRARDGRRQWDKSDAEHVRLLIETTGYVPETAWERAQLDKYGVPLPEAGEPDPEPIH